MPSFVDKMYYFKCTSVPSTHKKKKNFCYKLLIDVLQRPQ